MTMTIEQARAILVLKYGIYEPTEKQIAEFLLFGEVNEVKSADKQSFILR